MLVLVVVVVLLHLLASTLKLAAEEPEVFTTLERRPPRVVRVIRLAPSAEVRPIRLRLVAALDPGEVSMGAGAAAATVSGPRRDRLMLCTRV